MAPNRTYPSSPEELPKWMQALPGFTRVTAQMEDGADGDDDADWQVAMTLANDWAEDGNTDPLVVLAGLAFGAARIEEKLTEVVMTCRAKGKSWTQVGEALGMSKQSAWARFAGEE